MLDGLTRTAQFSLKANKKYRWWQKRGAVWSSFCHLGFIECVCSLRKYYYQKCSLCFKNNFLPSLRYQRKPHYQSFRSLSLRYRCHYSSGLPVTCSFFVPRFLLWTNTYPGCSTSGVGTHLPGGLDIGPATVPPPSPIYHKLYRRTWTVLMRVLLLGRAAGGSAGGGGGGGGAKTASPPPRLTVQPRRVLTEDRRQGENQRDGDY